MALVFTCHIIVSQGHSKILSSHHKLSETAIMSVRKDAGVGGGGLFNFSVILETYFQVSELTVPAIA